MDYSYMLRLGLMAASFAIVLAAVSFVFGYYMAKTKMKAAAEDKSIYLSRNEAVYHLSTDCTSSAGSRTHRTLNLCLRCP